MSAAATLAGAAPRRAIDWHAINWRRVYRTVRRLQARIVKATQQGRWGKVRALVYLLTHSFGGRALAVLRVTTNSGATTPGVDGQTWDTPEDKADAFDTLRRRGYAAQPLRRVFIPKSNGKLRPLGIPTMTDRAMQALYLLALDPIAETLADHHSYGFRRERSCADALEQCHIVLAGGDRASFILEGDIRAYFDRISHDWLLSHIPLDRAVLGSWLKAGFLDRNVFFATTAGTPQGGIISPTLANRALDGLQELLRQRFMATPRQRSRNKVHLVRYADDFIVTGTSERLLRGEVQPLVEHFLKERGLELSHEKTRLSHIEDGFDFLGQNVRRYRGGSVLLKPARKNVQAFLNKIRHITREEGRSLTAGQLIERLNPVIRGWAQYHCHAASKRTYNRVDRVTFREVWRWARRRHDQKSATWVKEKYFTRVGGRNWVLTGVVPGMGSAPPYRVYLDETRRTPIRRHIKVRGEANPYEPSWEPYFEERVARRMAATPVGRERVKRLWDRQCGKCPICGEVLLPEGGWQVHHWWWRVYGGDDLPYNLTLVHENCHRQVHSQGSVVEMPASREGRS
jgi:RNA-directed DNA polymerase